MRVDEPRRAIMLGGRQAVAGKVGWRRRRLSEAVTRFSAPTRSTIPRADGDREALRILLSARDELTTVNTAQTNRLRALLLAGDDTDRQLARARLTAAVLAGLIRRRLPRDADRPSDPAGRDPPPRPRIARRRTGTTGQPDAAGRDRRGPRPRADRTPRYRPGQRRPGHRVLPPPRTIRDDAAFAALGGISPLQASSGRTVRHRLNRGGDRALNKAIHVIATTRMRECPTTRA